jgi:hypothetical protein
MELRQRRRDLWWTDQGGTGCQIPHNDRNGCIWGRIFRSEQIYWRVTTRRRIFTQQLQPRQKKLQSLL